MVELNGAGVRVVEGDGAGVRVPEKKTWDEKPLIRMGSLE